MIDTKELRAVIQEIGLNGVCPAEINELIDRLEAAEKSDAESLAMYRKARDERDALRAKIAEMERQEPVAEWVETRFDGAKLYKLYVFPGAKGEEK